MAFSLSRADRGGAASEQLCNFSHSAVGISSHYVAVSPGSAWQALKVNFAENER